MTSFAITGNPNNAELGDVSWEPIKTSELPLNVLNISNDEVKMIALPEYERIKIWDEIFKEEKIEMF